MVIHLLAMEIEDPERMRAITSLVKELAGSELFLSGQVEEAPDGTPDV